MARKPTKKKAAPDDASREEMGEDIPPHKRWIEEIQLAKDANKPYWEMVDTIVKKYKDESDSDGQRPQGMTERKYNVLWSVTQTMMPLVYSQAPVPHISRKHNDRDPVARDATFILDRGLKADLEGDELHDALTEARDDYLLGSRGVIWPKYKPYMALRQSDEKTYVGEEDELPEDVELKEDEQGSYYHKSFEELVYEEVDWEHVHYRDFLHGAAAKWRHVPWVARRVPMTRKELIKRFDKKIGKDVPLTIDCKKKSKNMADEGDASKGMFAKAEVWEIWDKCERKVYWLCPNWDKGFLDEQDDFLKLEGFFPCPRPAYGTKTNESLIPTPDYKMWQDIAIELDEVTWRIKLLTEAMRVVGVYDKTMGDVIQRVTKQTRENDMIPVDSWAMFAEKGGLKGAIEFLPIENVAAVLDKLYMARQRLLTELYDITGVSDIVRGASDPRETAKAQQIKGQFANKRLKTRQDELLRMAREALEIHSQIMCKHYSPKTLRMISAADQVLVDPATQQPDERRVVAAMRLLQDAPLRKFRVKINEKNLAMPDETEDREQRVQFVQGVSQLLGSATQMIQVAPAAGPLLGEILLFAVRGFPLAKSTEAAMESALEQLLQQPLPSKDEGQGQTGPAPKSPEELAIDDKKVQLEHERALKELELKQQDLELRKQELALKKYEIDLQHQNRQQETRLREAKEQVNAQIKATQVENQAQAQQQSSVVQMQQFQAEQQQRVQENQRADVDQQHRHQLESAGAQREAQGQQFEQQNQYRQAFAGGGR